MKSPTAHFLLALGILLVVVSGYIAWYAALSQKSSSVADLQNQIVSENENIHRIASARAALAEIAGDEAKVQSYFVPEAGVVPFINALEARGAAEKATVGVLSVSKSDAHSRPTLLLTFTIKGSFDAVMRTLGAIEYAPYDISISTLSVQSDGKNSWNATVSLTVGSVPMKTVPNTP